MGVRGSVQYSTGCGNAKGPLFTRKQAGEGGRDELRRRREGQVTAALTPCSVKHEGGKVLTPLTAGGLPTKTNQRRKQD